MLPIEEVQLVGLLKKLQPGFLPYEVFLQISRLVTVPIVEFVPIRIKNGEPEVLLLKRDSTDTIWPNALHTPGTVIRSTDLDSEDHLAFTRIINDELKNTEVSEPYYVGSNLHKSKRGSEQAQIFWVEVLGDPKIGKFYQFSNLPKELIKSQVGFINLAVESFKKIKNS